ncbi:MAG: hypothetical protein OXU96_05210 [Gammaproteobacteria bacterium]|nr:hypothetical protein [Gammaproteobacteria bacterium]
MSEEKKCRIWGVPCEYVQVAPDTRMHHVQSSRAGGYYTITASAHRVVEKWSDIEKAKISRWIYIQNQLGHDPKVNFAVARQVLNWPMLSMMERVDYLLQFAELQTRNSIESPVLQQLNVDMEQLLEGKTDNAQQQLNSIFAATATLSFSALDHLMRQAEEAGFVTFNSRKLRDGRAIWISIEITMNGYKHLEKLKKDRTDSDQAFVAMWFDDAMSDAWENGFEPAIVDAGYKPMRIDRKEHINKIDDEIIAEIRRSRFVVADFTSEPKQPRGGVYYEAGFAHGLNIPVIYTCREDCLEDVHFDTRQFNHLTSNTPDDLRTDLAKRISAVLGDGPHRTRKQG